MPATPFDEVWAIDWSGARGRLTGIAVARLGSDAIAPALVPPPGGAPWTRAAVVDLLVAAIGQGRRVLAGFDFAFGLPAEVLPALGLAGCRDLPCVWRHVDQACAGAADLHGGPFVDAAPAGLFWRGGPRPPGWIAAMRMTDTRCAESLGARPESAMKLIGAKQVGLGALAGMRSLAVLRRRCGPGLAVWPADDPGRGSVAVEMFPTVYRRRATGSTAKIRDPALLARALAAFGCAMPPAAAASLGDDATDALVAAAGLREDARRASAFALPPAPRIRREGWIFGVPP